MLGQEFVIVGRVGAGQLCCWIGSEHNVCVCLDIVLYGPIVSSNWPEVAVLTGWYKSALELEWRGVGEDVPPKVAEAESWYRKPWRETRKDTS